MRRNGVFVTTLILIISLVGARAGFASVGMSGPNATVSSWNLMSTGSNNLVVGTLTVSALLSPYTVTVTADKTRMTEYSGSAYISGGKTLTAPLNVTAAIATPHCLVPGAGATAIIGTSTTLATGVGLAVTGCSDAFTITLSQATSLSDPALPAGHNYHIVLTYTVSGGL
jgi:hypothetical protein